MPQFQLDDQEMGQLMFVLANAEGKGITWAMVNPLLMKIGNQARMQAAALQPRPGNVEQPPPSLNNKSNGGDEPSQEAGHE